MTTVARACGIALLLAVACGAEVPNRCLPFASISLDGLSFTVYSCCASNEGPLVEFVSNAFAGGTTPAAHETPLLFGTFGWGRCDLPVGNRTAPLGLVYGEADLMAEDMSDRHTRILSMLDTPPSATEMTSSASPRRAVWSALAAGGAFVIMFV